MVWQQTTTINYIYISAITNKLVMAAEAGCFIIVVEHYLNAFVHMQVLEHTHSAMAET